MNFIFPHLQGWGYIYNKANNMKRVIRLTESDLRHIVKRVLNEQSKSGGNMDLKNKAITVVVKSSPYQEVQGRVTNLVDLGGGKKEISYVLDNGDVDEFVSFDEGKMEFGNYRIVKVDGQQVNNRQKTVTPAKAAKAVAPNPAQPQTKQYIPQQTINRIRGRK